MSIINGIHKLLKSFPRNQVRGLYGLFLQQLYKPVKNLTIATQYDRGTYSYLYGVYLHSQVDIPNHGREARISLLSSFPLNLLV